jgi:hypothetical protein
MTAAKPESRHFELLRPVSHSLFLVQLRSSRHLLPSPIWRRRGATLAGLVTSNAVNPTDRCNAIDPIFTVGTGDKLHLVLA